MGLRLLSDGKQYAIESGDLRIGVMRYPWTIGGNNPLRVICFCGPTRWMWDENRKRRGKWITTGLQARFLWFCVAVRFRKRIDRITEKYLYQLWSEM